jgi:hypothetical protein
MYLRLKDCNIDIDRVHTMADRGGFINLKPPPVPLIDAAVIQNVMLTVSVWWVAI